MFYFGTQRTNALIFLLYFTIVSQYTRRKTNHVPSPLDFHIAFMDAEVLVVTINHLPMVCINHRL